MAYLSALSAWVCLDGWLIAASHLFCGPKRKTIFFYIFLHFFVFCFPLVVYAWHLCIVKIKVGKKRYRVRMI